MPALRLDPDFEDADGFYAALIAAIDRAPSEKAAFQLLARLSLILANQVSSREALRSAIVLAETPPGLRG
ncbi:MAG: DUF2783 domain-containing protein [Hyphomonadaceae bacterium]|nr:DUF2783 domain-containing protein [Hyphomonadaceae bacterium]